LAELKPLVFKFGAGINSRTRLADVKAEEASAGTNFDLDVSNSSLRPRRPFKKIATTANAGPILGFGQLIKRDGTTQQFIQSASVVYDWDNGSGFATQAEATASSGIQLRGHRDHNNMLATELIITDHLRQSNVLYWDTSTGATGFQDFSARAGLTNLKAKYCRVVMERVVLANLIENAVDLPHMMAFSQVSTASEMSVSTKPSSAVGLDDAVQILSPNLRPINGMEVLFGDIVVSTEQARLFALEGSSSFDFAFHEFYPHSNAEGDDGLLTIGNDLIIGRAGALDLLSTTLKYGDVESDDVSRWIKNDIEKVTSWTIVYDQGRQRVLCFPNNQDAVYVLHKDLMNKTRAVTDAESTRASPWVKWVTNSSVGFDHTSVWTQWDSVIGEEAVYFGDDSGNIYRFDSEDEDTDAGTDPVTVSRRSLLVSVPGVRDMFDIDGWIEYTKQREASVRLNFLFGGEQSPTSSIDLTLPGSDEIGNFYNNETTLSAYYSGGAGDLSYYNAGYDNTIRRQYFTVAGHGNAFQLEVIVSSEGRDWQIEEIGLNISAAP